MLSRPSVGIYYNLIELQYASAKTGAFLKPFYNRQGQDSQKKGYCLIHTRQQNKSVQIMS